MANTKLIAVAVLFVAVCAVVSALVVVFAPQPNLYIDYCDPNPCMNDGACINETAGYSCQCKQGFQGNDCSEIKDDDACTSNPCMNGGNCTVTLAGFQSGFRCDCAQGYSGKVCTDCGGLLLNGDQCYYAVTGAFMNYSSAQDTCSRMFGGHLAYIKTNETHSAVTDYMTNIPGLFGYDLAWIGASYDPMKGGDEITWDDGDVTNIGSWWHPGFPHTGTRYRTATKMKFDVADRDNITFQGFVNWKEDRPNYPLCQFTF